MKTTMKFFAAILAVIAIAACGGKGIDDATKEAMTKFDTDWSAMMTTADSWVTTAQGELAAWKTGHESMDAIAATWTEEQKAAMQPHMDVCMTSVDQGTSMIDGATASIIEWKGAGEEWAAWKAKVDAGDVTPEDATKGMEDWNAKLTAANQTIESWNSNWTAMATTHTQAEEAMKSAMASTDEVAP